jgi:mycothiol synthase
VRQAGERLTCPASGSRVIVAVALLHAALGDLRVRGFRLAQAVLDESAGLRAASDLVKGGMPRVTNLLYLERETTVPLCISPEQSSARDWSGTPCACPHFEWRPFEPALEAEFRNVLQATYAGSLDMPELEGARALDDIMESHRAAGRFDPDRWRLGYLSGEPEAACVLLMAEIPGRDVWEVVYLGLTPAARGRGLGRSVVKHALELAAAHVSRLELAVDCRNTPAARLYQSTGFLIRDRRAVYLAILDQTSLP